MDIRRPGESEVAVRKELFRPNEVVAFVLCGGIGSRLRDLTGADIPKPLYPVAGKPILEHTIEPLVQADIGKIVFVTAYKGYAIRRHFDTIYQLPANSRTQIDYTDQKEPVGVLPGIVMALEEHKDSIKDSIMICDGDAIRRGLDVRRLYTFHKTHRRNTTMITTSVERTEKHWGIIANSSYDVIKIEPFPQTGSVPENIVFTGAMMLDGVGAAILRTIPTNDSSWKGMATLLQQFGSMNHYYSQIEYFNLNSPDVVEEAGHRLRRLAD
ncbi:MAG: NDP-sugar synthase [bacterium]|nr:NDP-sugar synthase [bacterium]